jgi:hypothetical protein
MIRTEHAPRLSAVQCCNGNTHHETLSGVAVAYGNHERESARERERRSRTYRQHLAFVADARVLTRAARIGLARARWAAGAAVAWPHVVCESVEQVRWRASAVNDELRALRRCMLGRAAQPILEEDRSIVRLPR